MNLPVIIRGVKEERKAQNPDFIQMNHGKLSINVLRRLFKRGTTEMVDAEVARFLSNFSSRSSWLSRNALKFILEEARQAMADDIESRRKAHDKAKGNLKGALRLIEKHLVENSQNADAWYMAGEILCRIGGMEEGYRAIGRAKELTKPLVQE